MIELKVSLQAKTACLQAVLRAFRTTSSEAVLRCSIKVSSIENRFTTLTPGLPRAWLRGGGAERAVVVQALLEKFRKKEELEKMVIMRNKPPKWNEQVSAVRTSWIKARLGSKGVFRVQTWSLALPLHLCPSEEEWLSPCCTWLDGASWGQISNVPSRSVQ